MTPKNLLIIMSDQHDPAVCGFSGHPLAKTPNLDRLAARGTHFTNAYCNSPICVPSRACFATGQYVHQHECWDNSIAWDGTVRGWTHRLREHGVANETIGKLHYRSSEDDFGIDRQIDPMHLFEGKGMLWGSIRNPLPARRGSPYFKTFGPGLSDYNRYDLASAAASREWLRDAADNRSAPWVLMVGLVAPHMPLVAPQEYFDLYSLDEIPDPILLPENGNIRHPWVQRGVDFMNHDGKLGAHRRKEAIRAYLALVSFMDARVGDILEGLDAAGLTDETRVIYTSDHGEMHGDRGLWGKLVFYEPAARIPLIMAGPEIAEGVRNSALCSAVDFFPTILKSVGVPRNETDLQLPGVNLLELDEKHSDRCVLSEYHAIGSPSSGYMIRQGSYKYCYYVGYPPELFDLNLDPSELVNLATDPTYNALIEDLHAVLLGFLDPEQTDAKAKTAQDRLVAEYGGPSEAWKIGNPGHTPVPGGRHE